MCPWDGWEMVQIQGTVSPVNFLQQFRGPRSVGQPFRLPAVAYRKAGEKFAATAYAIARRDVPDACLTGYLATLQMSGTVRQLQNSMFASFRTQWSTPHATSPVAAVRQLQPPVPPRPPPQPCALSCRRAPLHPLRLIASCNCLTRCCPSGSRAAGIGRDHAGGSRRPSSRSTSVCLARVALAAALLGTIGREERREETIGRKRERKREKKEREKKKEKRKEKTKQKLEK
jgi:hypothetical protein